MLSAKASELFQASNGAEPNRAATPQAPHSRNVVQPLRCAEIAHHLHRFIRQQDIDAGTKQSVPILCRVHSIETLEQYFRPEG
jgi:hypothetical protein